MIFFNRNVCAVVVFGINSGSGHLIRMTRLQKKLNFKFDIFVKTDSVDDFIIVNKINPQALLFEDFKENYEYYDLILWDDLGKIFDFKYTDKSLLIDPINLKHKYEMLKKISYTLNYNENIFKPVPKIIKRIFFADDKKIALILQGGGDDHKTVFKLANKLNPYYYVLAAVGDNCRHYNELKVKFSTLNGDILLNAPIIKLAHSADIIICSGGNILFEVQEYAKKIILYSDEFKEHKTFNDIQTNQNFMGYVEYKKDFDVSNYIKNTNNKKQKIGIEEFKSVWK